MRCRLSARGLTDRTSPKSVIMPVNISEAPTHARVSGSPERLKQNHSRPALGPHFRGGERLAGIARPSWRPRIGFELVSAKIPAAGRREMFSERAERHSFQ